MSLRTPSLCESDKVDASCPNGHRPSASQTKWMPLVLTDTAPLRVRQRGLFFGITQIIFRHMFDFLACIC